MIWLWLLHDICDQCFRRRDFAEIDKVSQTIQSPFPSIWLSVVNYFAVCVMSAIAMAFVMGGSWFSKSMKPKEKWSLGRIYGWCDFLCHNLILSANSDKIASSIPMLHCQGSESYLCDTLRLGDLGLILTPSLVSTTCPWETLSAGSENASSSRPHLPCWFCYFSMGFRQLVAVMYPIIGYLGVLMLVVLVAVSYQSADLYERKLKSSLVYRWEAFMIPIKTWPIEPRKRQNNFEKPHPW